MDYNNTVINIVKDRFIFWVELFVAIYIASLLRFRDIISLISAKSKKSSPDQNTTNTQ
jgi:hypothetical protein